MKHLLRLIAVAATALFLASCDSPEESIAKRCESAGDARYMAREFVKKTLLSPSSAKFDRSSETHQYLGNCRHLVTGAFESSNAFGGMIRKRYVVEVQYRPSGDTWFTPGVRITD